MADLLPGTGKQELNTSSLFSKISFSCSLLSILLLIIAFISMSSFRASENPFFLLRVLVIVTIISVMVGLFTGILSFMRKEKLKYLKTIGMVLNVLLFLFLTGATVFAIVMDYKRDHSMIKKKNLTNTAIFYAYQASKFENRQIATIQK